MIAVTLNGADGSVAPPSLTFQVNFLSSRFHVQPSSSRARSRQRPPGSPRPQEALPARPAGLRQPAAGPGPPVPALLHGHCDVRQRGRSRLDGARCFLTSFMCSCLSATSCHCSFCCETIQAELKSESFVLIVLDSIEPNRNFSEPRIK